jgi:peptidoglycan hydrolase-like protein with peptidoglycan-binding domain
MPGHPPGETQRVTGRRAVAGAVIVAALVAVTLAIVGLFGGAAASNAAGIDNGSATSTTTVKRSDLSSQTEVSATLGYADATTVSISDGTPPSNVQQAQQTSATAQSQLAVAEATFAVDERALVTARATLAADRRKLDVVCAGDNAAQTASGASGQSDGSAGTCATGYQSMATDEQAVATGAPKVQADRRTVSSARSAFARASEALSAAEASAATFGQTSVYTALPPVGRVVRRGDGLFAIDGKPTVLLYGTQPASRAFAPGMAPGSDVAQLNANLFALGYGRPVGDAFTSATAAAIRAFQAPRGIPATGRLLLGSVVFEPWPVRVTSVTPALGAAVQAGPVLGVTSTRRVVTIALDASQQTSVKVGDPVTITLPDNSTTPGHVVFVGTVATTPSNSDQGNGGSSTPTIEVDVTPDRPGATGRLDQAPVNVSITTGTVHDGLVVPVTALLALSGGGYAVEEVEAGGVHRLVGVQVGLFDDAEGLVQITGAGLAGGQRVVIPAS